MSNDIKNLSDTIIPKSDQLNSEQLLSGPMTIRVTDVRRGGGSDDQPIVIHYEGENGRPYKPCKSMRKVLIFAWGENGSEWVGKMMTLFNKRDVKWAGVEVGGIRISHLSHIRGEISLSLTATRGKKEAFIIKKIDATDATQDSRLKLEAAAREGMAALRAAWSSLPKQMQTAIGGQDGCPVAYKTAAAKADEIKAEPPKEPKSVAEIIDKPAEAVSTPTEGKSVF